MRAALELLAATVATLATVLALLGLAVRYVLFPWLQEHLSGPLLERLDTLAHRLEAVASDVVVAARMYEGHITHSERDRAALWDAVTDLRNMITPRHRRGRRPRREDNRS